MPQICPNCSTANRTTASFCCRCGISLPGKAKSASSVTGLLPPQSVLSERYAIVNRIGQGGMSAVYQATDLRIPGKLWAVKEMSDAAITNPLEKQEARQAFEREAELLSKLNHPSIPQVTDFFSESGKLYLVMEFVAGETLEAKLEQYGTPFSEAEVLSWAEQLCDVLIYLHNHTPPIIFRDLKPGNIMLDPGGRIKLIDFGIARFFQAGRSKDTIAIGTDGFAPIEQYGQGQTDARSDVYALGATLYTLLAGEVPPSAIDRFAQKIPLTSPSQLNSGVSPAVERAIFKALELKSDQRFQTISEFRQALTGQLSTQSRAQSTTPASAAPSRLTQPMWIVAALVILVLVGIWLARGSPFGETNPTSTPAADVAVAAKTTTPTSIGGYRKTPTPTKAQVTVSTSLSAEDNPSPTWTPAPTRTPTPKPPTATHTPWPTPTRRRTSTPTSTPRPTSTPLFRCEHMPDGEFASFWQKNKDILGCAERTKPLYGQFSEMPFEKGHLFWLRDIDVYGQSKQVIVKIGGQNKGDTGTWLMHTVNWNGEGICNVPSPPRDGLYLPDRELAKVWCEVDGLNRLGYALAPQPFTPNRGIDAIQNFEKAVLFRDSDGHSKGLVYVFFWKEGTYRRLALK